MVGVSLHYPLLHLNDFKTWKLTTEWSNLLNVNLEYQILLNILLTWCVQASDSFDEQLTYITYAFIMLSLQVFSTNDISWMHTYDFEF
jgi:hypothetical protein